MGIYVNDTGWKHSFRAYATELSSQKHLFSWDLSIPFPSKVNRRTSASFCPTRHGLISALLTLIWQWTANGQQMSKENKYISFPILRWLPLTAALGSTSHVGDDGQWSVHFFQYAKLLEVFASKDAMASHAEAPYVSRMQALLVASLGWSTKMAFNAALPLVATVLFVFFFVGGKVYHVIQLFIAHGNLVWCRGCLL